MAGELTQWLKQHLDAICEATLYRAPNMLPDELDVAEFLAIVSDSVEAPPDERLSAMQSWALTTIGRDAMTAGDWLTILRVLKEEIGRGLEEHFSAQETLRHWRQVESLLTSAIIEAAQLTSYMGQADLLEHTIRMREEIERLEQSKTNFITVAAHELRTPLTIVEGYANMLREDANPNSPQGLYIRGLDNGLMRMQEIIGDMIDVSLLDLQSFELNYQRTNLEKIIGLVSSNLEKHYETRRVSLIVEPFAVTQATYADPRMLAKAFEKVLYNGLKYTPDGGRVTVSGRQWDEPDGAGDIAGYVTIQITDTGIGIDPQNLQRIFAKFSSLADARHHSSSKTAFKGGGAGLGLPITKGIIEAHGGRIWAESSGFDEVRCPGTTFFIELPIFLTAPVSVEGD